MASKNQTGRFVPLACLASAFLVIAALTGRSLADAPPRPTYQSQAEADQKSVGCISCHTGSDSRSMHTSADTFISCVDCHGGHGDVTASGAPGSAQYEQAKRSAHVASRTGVFR